MKIDVVVDVGNTNIKWGHCSADGEMAIVRLPLDSLAAWQAQCDEWNLPAGLQWVVAGVNPGPRDGLIQWLKQRGESIYSINSHQMLPLSTSLEHPEKAGIDRLLNAVAANAIRRPHHPAVIIDAGSAVTVDYVNEHGVYCGGAILPGFRLMAKALHDYTALLPVVSIDCVPPMLGDSTTLAMQVGIFWSVCGGVTTMINEHQKRSDNDPDVFLTGGDAPLLAQQLIAETIAVSLRENLTLEGIRLTMKS